MPDFDVATIKRVSKKLENGVLIEPIEVQRSLALLKHCEDRLIKFTRQALSEAANTEMINIEFERLGLKDAA